MNASFNDRIGARLAQRTNGIKPHADILSYELVSPTVAKVVVAHSHRGTTAENRAALASLLEGRGNVIPHSFREIETDNAHQRRMLSVGFVGANVLSEELSEERASQLKEIAKNVLMDDTDNSMWQVTQASDGRKFIRRQHNEDLAELMTATASVNPAAIVPKHFTEIAGTTVDTSGPFTYAAYVDADTHQVRFGYVVEHATVYNGYKHTILPRDASEVEYVSASLIVEAAYNVDPNNRLTTARNRLMETAGIPDIDAVKSYFRKEFGYGPEFLRELEAEIDEHAVA